LISISHSAGLEGYQLPANTALLSFVDFMAVLLISGSRLKAKGLGFWVRYTNVAGTGDACEDSIFLNSGFRMQTDNAFGLAPWTGYLFRVGLQFKWLQRHG
jgi:hypothetical protein